MAQINELQIGLDVLVGAGSGLLGAMAAYFKLKSRLDLQEAENLSQEKEIDDLRERKKEMNAALHKIARALSRTRMTNLGLRVSRVTSSHQSAARHLIKHPKRKRCSGGK